MKVRVSWSVGISTVDVVEMVNINVGTQAISCDIETARHMAAMLLLNADKVEERASRIRPSDGASCQGDEE